MDPLLLLLSGKGLLNEQQIAHIEERSKTDNIAPVDVIRSERLIPDEDFAKIYAEFVDVPYIDLRNVEMNPTAMKDISRKAAGTYRFIAFDIKDKSLIVAMESPDDFQALEAIKFIAKRKGLVPVIHVASSEAIEDALGGAGAVEEEIGVALKEFSQELSDAKVDGKKGIKEIERIVGEAPVTKVVAVMIRNAIEGHSSDIHIEPTEKEVRIRYRVDGKLHTTLTLPPKVHSAIISRIKILANLKIDESRLPQDGRFSATIDNRAYDFRVATMPTTFGEKVAIRILDKASGAPSFEELGLRGETQKSFVQYLHAPYGIILISGPTGSGKSTTLFTSLTMLNDAERNIVTLEDPVEYEVGGINQTQVQPEIGLTFASGLRSILRQDPDIIMVGEIRDRETAELSVHAALTGHLVLSSIHTNNAIGAIPRLIDMGIDGFLLSASIRLLAAQRLIPRLCQKCKKESPLPDAVREKIVAELKDVPESAKIEENQKNPKILYESPGCPECKEMGVSGRVAIFEVVPISRNMRVAINEFSGFDDLAAIAKSEGMISIRQEGILKALTGEVRYEDVLRVTSEIES